MFSVVKNRKWVNECLMFLCLTMLPDPHLDSAETHWSVQLCIRKTRGKNKISDNYDPMILFNIFYNSASSDFNDKQLLLIVVNVCIYGINVLRYISNIILFYFSLSYSSYFCLLSMLVFDSEGNVYLNLATPFPLLTLKDANLSLNQTKKSLSWCWENKKQQKQTNKYLKMCQNPEVKALMSFLAVDAVKKMMLRIWFFSCRFWYLLWIKFLKSVWGH